MSALAPMLVVTVKRNPKHNDLVDYTIAKLWNKRTKDAKRPLESRRRLLAEGSFVHPEPIQEVTLAIDGMTASAWAQPRDGVPGTPGRERSGFENVPLPLELPQQPPPEPTATTPEEPTTA